MQISEAKFPIGWAAAGMAIGSDSISGKRDKKKSVGMPGG
jgi:hypothetical protein